MLQVMPHGAWDTRASLPWLRTSPVPPVPVGFGNTLKHPQPLQPLTKCLPTPQASRMKATPPEPLSVSRMVLNSEVASGNLWWSQDHLKMGNPRDGEWLPLSWLLFL